MNLTINNASTSTITETACDSYTSPSGKHIWTSSNTYLDTIPNAVNCDSVITVNLTINTTSTSTITETACDSYTSPSGKYVWTSSNTYLDTIPNAANCDSVITVILTINNVSSSTITETACDSYTSPSGKYIWTSSNTYLDTIPNAANCDSVITVNLTINNASSSTITETACDSYTSPSGKYVWTSSNTYLDTIPNAANCDSVITVNLTINNVSDLTTTLNGFTITSNNNSATYIWLDCNNNFSIIPGETGQSFTASTNGNYAVQLTENNCIDTSSCVAVVTTVLGIIENDFGDDFMIYPNPTSGSFSIDIGDNHGDVSISIMDLTGKIIKSKQYNQSQLLNLSIEEPVGVYLLTIESRGKRATIRLVKE